MAASVEGARWWQRRHRRARFRGSVGGRLSGKVGGRRAFLAALMVGVFAAVSVKGGLRASVG